MVPLVGSPFRAWLTKRWPATLVQVGAALVFTFAFAIPLAVLLVAVQDPATLPGWANRILGLGSSSFSYSTLSIVLLVIIGLWIVTSGVTGKFRAWVLAREVTELSATFVSRLGASPSGADIRKNNQRLNIERQLIDSHYSLAVTFSRTIVFFLVAVASAPLFLVFAVVFAQILLARSAFLRFHDGVNIYERFADITSRSTAQTGDPAVVAEFGEWIADWEQKFNALPFRDYLVTAALIVGGVALQVASGTPIESWAHGVPVVGVWAVVAFDLARSFAHYGFSIGRWGASTTGDFY